MNDCKAEAEEVGIQLFDGFCPNDASKIIGLEWKESTIFSLHLFRVGDATSLTFKCSAFIYPQSVELCNCDTESACPFEQSLSNRKRRSLAKDTIEFKTTVRIKGNSKQPSSANINSISALGVPLLHFVAY